MKTKTLLFCAAIAAIVCSCGAGPEPEPEPELIPALSSEKVEIFVDSTMQISSVNCTITRWEIENNFIADIDDSADKDVQIYGMHVGKTKLIAYYNVNDSTEGSLTADIIVKGNIDLCTDPNTDFSLTAENLQKAIGNATQDINADAYRTLVYGDINKDKYITCYDYFNDILTEIRVCFPNITKEEELEDIYNFIFERYEETEDKSGDPYVVDAFIDAYDDEDATLIVRLKTDKVFGKPVVELSYIQPE